MPSGLRLVLLVQKFAKGRISQCESKCCAALAKNVLSMGYE
jgi:hypothetical protein